MKKKFVLLSLLAIFTITCKATSTECEVLIESHTKCCSITVNKCEKEITYRSVERIEVISYTDEEDEDATINSMMEICYDTHYLINSELPDTECIRLVYDHTDKTYYNDGEEQWITNGEDYDFIVRGPYVILESSEIIKKVVWNNYKNKYDVDYVNDHKVVIRTTELKEYLLNFGLVDLSLIIKH